jgi:hypothetical protein
MAADGYGMATGQSAMTADGWVTVADGGAPATTPGSTSRATDAPPMLRPEDGLPRGRLERQSAPVAAAGGLGAPAAAARAGLGLGLLGLGLGLLGLGTIVWAVVAVLRWATGRGASSSSECHLRG